jgi:hypothetical protein
MQQSKMLWTLCTECIGVASQVQCREGCKALELLLHGRVSSFTRIPMDSLRARNVSLQVQGNAARVSQCKDILIVWMVSGPPWND